MLLETQALQLDDLLVLLVLTGGRQRAHLHDLHDRDGVPAHLRVGVVTPVELPLNARLVEGYAAQRDGAERRARIPHLAPEHGVRPPFHANLEVLLEVDRVVVPPLILRRLDGPRALHLVHAVVKVDAQGGYPAVGCAQHIRMLGPPEHRRVELLHPRTTMPGSGRRPAEHEAPRVGHSTADVFGLLGVGALRGLHGVSAGRRCRRCRRVAREVHSPDANLEGVPAFFRDLVPRHQEGQERVLVQAELPANSVTVDPSHKHDRNEQHELDLVPIRVDGIALLVHGVERETPDGVDEGVPALPNDDAELLVIGCLDGHDTAQG
mmetsp:Transcript_68081/g.197160  ORF Transcript_68081/g.197160 Transcript_68081/m.197160 type:complete len:322 (+) Transcript_68081:145-1110(+)